MRERIWKDVEELIEEGDAVMAWAAPTDQGYDFATVGRNRRMPDGLLRIAGRSIADCRTVYCGLPDGLLRVKVEPKPVRKRHRLESLSAGQLRPLRRLDEPGRSAHPQRRRMRPGPD